MDKIEIGLRLWSKAECGQATKCWNWLYYKNNKGYGVIHMDGRATLAHRVAYELTKGSIPTGLKVCHRCDNPACINPLHLFLGSQKDNMHDMAKKGRAIVGENRTQSKLTWAKVRDARSKYANCGVTQRVLAKEMGISQAILCDVLNNKRWVE